MVVAHAGHWLVNLIYLFPVLVVGSFLGIQVIKDRRRGDHDDGDTNNGDDR